MFDSKPERRRKARKKSARVIEGRRGEDRVLTWTTGKFLLERMHEILIRRPEAQARDMRYHGRELRKESVDIQNDLLL
jgi:hypothetical protein